MRLYVHVHAYAFVCLSVSGMCEHVYVFKCALAHTRSDAMARRNLISPFPTNKMQGMQAAGTRHRDLSPTKGRGTSQYTTPSNSVTHSPAHSTRSPRGMSAGGGGSGGRQQQTRMEHTAAW